MNCLSGRLCRSCKTAAFICLWCSLLPWAFCSDLWLLVLERVVMLRGSYTRWAASALGFITVICIFAGFVFWEGCSSSSSCTWLSSYRTTPLVIFTVDIQFDGTALVISICKALCILCLSFCLSCLMLIEHALIYKYHVVLLMFLMVAIGSFRQIASGMPAAGKWQA